MHFTQLQTVAAFAVVLAPALELRSADDLPPPISSESFARHFEMMRPLPGEWRWREEIPWVGTIHEARERAAREDKPILAWQSANSPPLGST